MAEIRVFCSGAFKAAHLALKPAFEAASGHRVRTAWGSSVAGAPTSIPARMERGEPVDAVILSRDGLMRLVDAGRVVAESCTDLVRSGIGAAVRAGDARPDLGSVEALTDALLACRSVAISTSASGLYLGRLFERLGVADCVAAKLIRTATEPVGAIVARGEAEIGFQQMSELLPIEGIDIVGPLPAEAQELTVFSAGISAHAAESDAARELIAYLTGPSAHPAIREAGMEPVTGNR